MKTILNGLGLAAICMLVFGIITQSWWFGFGVVLAMTSAVCLLGTEPPTRVGGFQGSVKEQPREYPLSRKLSQERATPFDSIAI